MWVVLDVNVSVLTIREIRFVQIRAGYNTLSGSEGKTTTLDAPAKHYIVIYAVNLGVPGSPTFIKSRGDEFRHEPLEFRTSKQGNMDPVWKPFEQWK